ncbi:hypothetical protein BpHYR1_021602 [Brachionus plicatilis]|uniref:Secreted protein n=1 Tax=Brachionus plicatilis TaxID=10195 RepID=A0A3M7SVD5_BRAPC|nr:hypothetical protein BpHYR1_021602 [Brachionus plicatilis]
MILYRLPPWIIQIFAVLSFLPISYVHCGSSTSVYFCGPVSLSSEGLMQVLLNSRSCSRFFQRLQTVHGSVPDHVKDPFSILDDRSIRNLQCCTQIS